jgi:hypothetical protein
MKVRTEALEESLAEFLGLFIRAHFSKPTKVAVSLRGVIGEPFLLDCSVVYLTLMILFQVAPSAISEAISQLPALPFAL